MFRLRVKEILQEKGISQGKLSRGADLPATTVRRLVHDTNYIPSALTLDKVARFLNVSVESLYYHDDAPKPHE
jgi:transcriptional regulator with XRE-family HTH domain